MNTLADAPRRHQAGPLPGRRTTKRPHGSTAVPGVVTASGEVDLATAPDLRARLLEAVRRHPAGVVVDLSGVTFADCRAVGALIAARNLATQLGRPRPVLRGTPPPVARLLKATGTHHLFTHHA